MLRRRPPPTLFPYTTLFRSAPGQRVGEGVSHRLVAQRQQAGALHQRGALLRLPRLNESIPTQEQRQGGMLSFRRSEEHTSELQSRGHLVCRLLLEKKKHRRK